MLKSKILTKKSTNAILGNFKINDVPIKSENGIKQEPEIKNPYREMMHKNQRKETNTYLPSKYFSPVDSSAFSYKQPPKCPPQ